MSDDHFCRSCNSTELKVFLDLGKTPLADRISAVIRAMRHEANYLEANAPCPRCHSYERTPVIPQNQK